MGLFYGILLNVLIGRRSFSFVLNMLIVLIVLIVLIGRR